MKKVPSLPDLWVRFSLVLLGVTWTIGLPIIFGFKKSYSEYHADSPFLFSVIFCVLAVGMLTHRDKRWVFPSIFLIFVTLLNMHDFPFAHHASAVVFFLSSTYVMWNDKQAIGFGGVSLCTYLLFLISAFWFEMIQILLICFFHLVYNFGLFKSLQKRQDTRL